MKKQQPPALLWILLLLIAGVVNGCSGRTGVPGGVSRNPLPQNPDQVATIQFSPTPSPQLTPTLEVQRFDGERALQDAAHQMQAGPRTVGSPAHTEIGDWIAAEAANAGWEVEIQETTYQGQPVRNIIAKWGEGSPWVILGAHYDSRLAADQDPDPLKQSQAVPGANDGASGVAVLLELARTLPGQMQATAQVQPADMPRAEQVWLVFFDSEDNGRLPGWDWLLGSRAFVEMLQAENSAPALDAAVIIDMIGDTDLQIPFEQSSDTRLNQEIWAQAAANGYGGQFPTVAGPSMIDDHTPFLEVGIPAADLIDFNYPYWHTTEDTLDKISAASLQAVGDTLIAWLLNGSSVFRK